MFTGLVREFGKVLGFQQNILTLKAKHRPKVGDSIAVNGACLTAIEIFNNGFSVELSEETQSHIALESYQDLVHIEPALRLQDRLDGHLVQGHIDGIGEIIKIIPHSIGIDFFITANRDILKLCIPKGSIAINGISLTINEVLDDSLRLTLIPHTIQNTLFGQYKVGTKVNIETDMFARMVQHFLSNKKDSNLTWEKVDRILGSY
ncbi:riboflavin synthase [Helicobacter canadensis]|uniref:Riboflavin synthase n=1 Tax=Helicobacter canadensis MIT 98-5491 TaxID=537970 RepID=C5ZY98_9HELI|nr:riboflavin synthase [Helicobacter canadensis]EES90116.1 riboflavin synthase subunit alpha [Helicobacter canadensis MIT 98-5491]EFR49270.1 riboflavin synthase, alpha subunit [Helicobacter canadensis MIT 98-5491]STP02379.1 Riboflavin synthase eubacterial/eukaryotic [Helicobacter canadensis]